MRTLIIRNRRTITYERGEDKLWFSGRFAHAESVGEIHAEAVKDKVEANRT